MAARSADWERAKTRYPSTTSMNEQDWLSFFDGRPDVLWGILGDVAKVVTATEAEKKRSGRRPGVTGMSLDDLDKLIRPRYCMEPFPAALRELIGKKSLRSFAAKVPCNHMTLIRLQRGEIPYTLPLLEAIAAAGKVHPAFFCEYRAMFVADLISQVLSERPNLSIRAVKQLGRAGAFA